MAESAETETRTFCQSCRLSSRTSLGG